jgi:hypothetical protein
VGSLGRQNRRPIGRCRDIHSVKGICLGSSVLYDVALCSYRNGEMTKSRMKPVSLGRHRRNCSICVHPQRVDIEAEFIAWRSPAVLAQQYGLGDRASIYRHAHALGLFAKRQRNVRAALERIIEKAGDIEVTASAVVAAVVAYAKINASGQWIDRSEQVTLTQLFERMTRQELEAYARNGELPDWFADWTTTGTTTLRTENG